MTLDDLRKEEMDIRPEPAMPAPESANAEAVGAGGWRVWHLLIGLFVMSSVMSGFDYYRDRKADQRLAQAAYDYGTKVGRIMGNCDALKSVAKANPDSIWAADPTVVRALSTCAKAAKIHGPGTVETLKVPP